MKEFKAVFKDDVKIVLADKEELKDLYRTIVTDNENFLLIFVENKVTKTEVMISNNIVAKVLNGEILLVAEER